MAGANEGVMHGDACLGQRSDGEGPARRSPAPGPSARYPSPSPVTAPRGRVQHEIDGKIFYGDDNHLAHQTTELFDAEIDAMLGRLVG